MDLIPLVRIWSDQIQRIMNVHTFIFHRFIAHLILISDGNLFLGWELTEARLRCLYRSRFTFILATHLQIIHIYHRVILCLIHAIIASLSVSVLLDNLSANFSHDYRRVLAREGCFNRFLVFLGTLQFKLPYWTLYSNHNFVAASGLKFDSVRFWPLQLFIICHSRRFHNYIN